MPQALPVVVSRSGRTGGPAAPGMVLDIVTAARNAHVVPSVADRLTDALLRCWEDYLGLSPAATVRRIGGVLAGVSGVPEPSLNGVIVGTETVDQAAVTRLLAMVAELGVPYSLQGRPAANGPLAILAEEHGLIRGADVPLMALHDTGRLSAAQAVPELAVRQLGPTEGAVHREVVAAGFGAPIAMVETLVPAEVLAAPAVRVYAAELDGSAVSTGLSVTLGRSIGIFNVATVPEYRGRGYGGAVTARLVADAFSANAVWACLQSSPEGRGMYRRLGFEVVEMWSYWVAAPA